MRVLWVIKGLGPGGAENLLASTARVADHSRFAYDVAYLLPHKDHLVAALEGQGVRTHCLQGRRVLSPGWVLRLQRLIQGGDYDVVHLHSPMVAAVARLVVLLGLGRAKRPAVVSTEHNAWWSYSRPTRWANALLFRSDARRWAVSEHVRSTIWPWMRRGTEVLVHGLVLEDVERARGERPQVRRELGAGPDDVLVVTVANYRHQKGYPDLLAAAAAVLAAEPRARFCAVGQGPLEVEIKTLHASLGLGERFVLTGYRPDALAVLGAGDVFALASLHEGFPIAVMEALAMGLPVVSTSTGGVPDAIQEGVQGFVLPVGRPDMLAERLLQLCRDDELRHRQSEAAALAGRVFDIRHAVRRMEESYALLAHESGRRNRGAEAS